MKNILCVILLILYSSCIKNSIEIIEDRPPVKREIFIDIILQTKLIDAIKSQNIIRQASGKRQQLGQYKYTFEKFGVSKDEFTITFDYYKSKPDSILAIYNEVLRRLKIMEDMLDHESANTKESEKKD